MKDNPNCENCNKQESCKDKRDGPEFDCKNSQMALISHKIIIASGKGGVGKSTVSVNLARSLQMKGFLVGVLDADITGPNIPKLLGIDDKRMKGGDRGIEPAISKHGIKVVSMALVLSNQNTPVIWRGPMKMAAIKQFIEDVNWGQLDFLLIDLPPGTSDEPMSVLQLIPDMSGAIIVTTPQEVSLLDSRKAVNMALSMRIPVLGVIENMSGFVCSHCKKTTPVFGSDGGRKMAKEMNVPFLGEIPIDPLICDLGDGGQTFVDNDILASSAFGKIVEKILQELN